MRYKPFILIILGILHLVEPLIKTPLYARLFGVDIITFIKGIVQGGSFLEIYSFFALMPVAGIAIIAVKNWSLPVFIVSEILEVIINVNLIKEWNRPEQLFIAYSILGILVVNLIVVSYFLIPAVRRVYQDEKLRWWETNTRYKVKIPCSVEYSLSGEKRTGDGIILNIAEGGLFLSSDKLPEQGSEITIQFGLKFADNLNFSLTGKVVFLRTGDESGFGVQLINLNDLYSKKIAQFLQSLELMGVERVFQNESSFSQFKNWLIQFLTTGKGIFPKLPNKYK